MLLAAGYGSRLGPLTDAVPKCMLKIADKPVIEYAIRWLCRYGVTEMLINVCHLAEVITSYVGNGSRWGIKVTYSEEIRPLGTAGALRQARWFFDRPSYVWYGDNLSTCDLGRLSDVHREGGGVATIALCQRDDPSASGVVELGPGDRVVRFLEKPHPDQTWSRWINAGIYIVEPDLIAMIPEREAPDFGYDVFPAVLAQGHRLYGYRMSASERLWWIDTPQDLDHVRAHLRAEGLAAMTPDPCDPGGPSRPWRLTRS